MRFFSGFCLQGERELFAEFLQPNDFTVAGFSYGAIKALEYTLQAPQRIDRLVLLSPAYFANKDAKFKKMQLLFFKKDPESYIRQFLQNVASPSALDMSPYLQPQDSRQLHELLHYDWQKLGDLDPNLTLEIHLGGKDRIIDAHRAHDFFKRYGESYLHKNLGHILHP